MKIKKSQVALGLAAVVAISSIGLTSSTLAAGRGNGINQSASSTAMHLGRGNERPALTEAQKAEIEAKKTAEEAALKAGNYSAWVTAVGSDCPMLEKINASNFSRYVELYNLREQERTIMTELGIEKENGHGLGKGMGRGMGLGLQK
jgi:hypothetical protein